MRIVLFAVFAILTAVCASPLPADAQTKIIAVVNGSPITTYDLAQRQRLLKLTGGRGNLRELALEELIDERVKLDAAAQLRIVPTDARVNAAIANIGSRVKLSPAQLRAALAQQGVNISTLEERLRAQIAFSELVRARFNQQAPVREQDLVAALLKNKEKEPAVEAAFYDLQRVTIALPADPSPQRLKRAEGAAKSLRQKFTSCSSGLQMARKTRNVVVQPYGKRLETDLDPRVREALKDLPVGRLTDPIRGARGLTMFALCDKKMVRSTNAAMKDLEVEMRAERGEQFQKQYARQLRRDAVIERY